MEALKKDQVVILYNIVNETESTKRFLKGTKRTYIGSPFGPFLVKIHNTGLFIDPVFTIKGRTAIEEVRPVARFTVRRLHNTDPETII